MVAVAKLHRHQRLGVKYKLDIQAEFRMVQLDEINSTLMISQRAMPQHVRYQFCN